MARLVIGLPSGLRRKDGGPAFTGYDVSALAREGSAEFVYFNSKAELGPDDLSGLDGAVLLGERITSASFPNSDRLAIFARMGVGFDTLDLEACTARDVVVTTTPDAVRRPMAVAVLTSMLALSTHLMAKDRMTRQGPAGWQQRHEHHGLGLVGRTLGVVGIGNIGAEVLRVVRPLEMRLIAHDPYVTAEHAASLGAELVELDELFRQADVVSINCPLSEETRHLVNARTLGLMKPTAFLINTSRGGTLDQAALYDALAERRIAGAALDVMAPEPTPESELLNRLDNVILTPHALGWTDQTWRSMAEINMAAFRAVLAGRAPENVVNKEVLERPGFRAKLKRLSARN
jgi:phosphoglycerate dehydrogenase-like enzyme